MAESAETECLIRNRRVRVLVALGRTDDALAAYRALDRSCGDWVRRYPWEYYARSHVSDAANRLGAHLHSRRRFAEAISPLTYASDWGIKDASFYLADMYRTGHGVKEDPARARQLYALGTRQSMKRFTVQTNFGSVKAPFNIYISEYGLATRCKAQAAAVDPAEQCAGFDGIDDQAMWVSELRDGAIPKEVIENFQKLAKIAKDNNVSLPDLAAYALGDTKKAEAPAADPDTTPLTDAAPTVTGTALFAIDVRGKTPHQVETRVVPFLIDGGCFGWRIGVTPEQRRVKLRRVLDFPQAPKNLPTTNGSTVENNGRRSIKHSIVSLDKGAIGDFACQEQGDPIGPHTVEIFAGEVSLFKVTFELAPDDGLFEWIKEEPKAESVPAAQGSAASAGG